MMTKESVRKCSHCGHNGHNSRTCNGKGCGVKLFGVRIDGVNNVGVGKDETRSPVPLLCTTDDRFNGVGGIESSTLRKCKSLGNLQAAACNNIYEANNNVVVEHGYLSDDHLHQSKRRKVRSCSSGTSWTESEHRKFLIGLKKLGKGDWRGISRNYVSTRTPTQVASHAQKYFIRMASEKKKRRSSVFDTPLKEETPSPPASPPHKDPEVSLQLSVSPPTAMKTTTSNIQGQASTSKSPSVASSEKPPLSPVARTFSVPDFHTTPHMVGYPSMGPRIMAENNYTPTVLFAPVFNYANNKSHFYPYDSRVAFATCSPFMTPRLLVQPLLSNGTSQTAKNDGLAAGIGALPLSI